VANPENKVNFRTIDWNAEVKKIWGPKYNAPVTEYEFSNGRTFERRTEHAAIYDTSPDFG